MGSTGAVLGIRNWARSSFINFGYYNHHQWTYGHILKTPPTQTQASHVQPSSFPFSLCITVLKDLETLVEVAAEQFYGEEKKWNFLAITEAIKVLLRSAILKKSGYKMLLHGGETVKDEGEYDSFDSQKNTPSSQPGPQGVPSILKNHHERTPWSLERRALSALNSFGEKSPTISEPTWLHRVKQQQDIMEPSVVVAETPSLSTFLSEKGVSGGLFLMVKKEEIAVGTLPHERSSLHHVYPAKT